MIVNTENQVEGLAPEELNKDTVIAEGTNDVQDASATDVSVDPDPPVNKEKVYSYLVSLYDNAGKGYNESKLRQISSTSDIRYWVNWAHGKTGQEVLDDNSWKKLSSTWVDQVKVEKKKSSSDFKKLTSGKCNCSYGRRYGFSIHIGNYSFNIGFSRAD